MKATRPSESCWWLAADTPLGWYHYEYEMDCWIYTGTSYTNFSFTYRGFLIDLPPYEVLNMSGLPEGMYTAYFGVDMDMNGLLDLDQLYYDSVVVII